ncbi:MAG: 50S ribosomal protein L18 [Bdellovibrionaceae bacterium]|nr:50S ribosomal protein L18 [Bdellovibrionales bacterium]MCB9084657.1 50S ribosomal protein L18 [Pseudobdellovibrionaceae bacterium]
MRIKFKKKTASKVVKRLKSKARIRKKVAGTAERPRLAIFRSTRNIYAQIIDDVSGKVLVSASTLKVAVPTQTKEAKTNKEAAKAVGSELAKLALAKNIKNVVFDRSGYLYHGRIKALAEAAREAGLTF